MTSAGDSTQDVAAGDAASFRRRIGFVDSLRALALVRVVLYHAANAGLFTSYLVTAMPLMFFCGGAVAQGSFSRERALPVFERRFRRVLVPFWFYGAIACVVMFVASQVAPGPGTHLSVANVLSFAVPMRIPTGSAWGRLFVQHLWYIAVYLELIVVTPALLWCYQRARVPLIASLVTANLIVHWVVTADGWNGRVLGFQIPGETWLVLTFAPFWCLGFAYRDGTLARLSRRSIWVIAVGLGVAALVFWRTAEVGDGHVLMQLAGGSWLFAALAVEPFLERLAAARYSGTVVTYLNRRALTVYLWHLVAIWATVEFIKAVPFGNPMLDGAPWWFWRSLGAVTLTFAFCVLFGWIEDIAARRRPTLLLGRSTASSDVRRGFAPLTRGRTAVRKPSLRA